MLIFSKQTVFYKTLFIKRSKILMRFLQKPVRNINISVGEFLIRNNESLFNNKGKYNVTTITTSKIITTTNLNKKIIV